MKEELPNLIIKLRRRRLGMEVTQKEMADFLQITREHYNRLEKGKHNMTISQYCKLDNFLQKKER